jgi:hypothetical protein
VRGKCYLRQRLLPPAYSPRSPPLIAYKSDAENKYRQLTKEAAILVAEDLGERPQEGVIRGKGAPGLGTASSRRRLRRWWRRQPTKPRNAA